MSYYLIIAVSMLVAFILQFAFSSIQMKGFNKYYAKFRKMGRVALGKNKGGFYAGAIVMFAVDDCGIIIKGCYMRGFTFLAKFKEFDRFDGMDVGAITQEDVKGLDVSLRRAILNTTSNYNTIMAGGEVEEKPGILSRLADKVYGIGKRNAAAK